MDVDNAELMELLQELPIKPVTLRDMERAVNFYECGPDGQYDHVAAFCIKRVLAELKGELR